MPDNVDDLLLPLLRAADRVAWDEPAEVRGRGQARARNRAIAVGLAVVLAAGLGAGSAWALGRPDGGGLLPADPDPSATGTAAPDHSPSPTGSPDVSPSGTTTKPSTTPPTAPPQGAAIPPSAMLQSTDLAASYGVSDAPEGDDHGSIPMLMSYCGQGGYSTAAEHHTAFRRRHLSVDDQRYVLQQTNRYQASWAAQHLRDLRAVLPRCTTVHIGGNPENPATLTVIASDFAGDGSLLIKDVGRDADGPYTQYHAVVRQGDVETMLRIHIGGLTDNAARDLARKAATRLCAATPTC